VLASLYVHASLTWDTGLPRLFIHLRTGLTLVRHDGARADRYDVAIEKHGGAQGPPHTAASVPELQRRLRSEAARWDAARRLRCPDGSEISVSAQQPAW
jgi:hypothetical protein